jgi:hypothetical protein
MKIYSLVIRFLFTFFNFMAMSCLLQLIILWHLSKATRLFLVHVSITSINESQIQLLIFKFLLMILKEGFLE